jgi:surface antigen
MSWSAPVSQPKQNKIVSRFSARNAKTLSNLPNRLGGINDQQFVQQRPAVESGSNYAANPAVTQFQETQIKRPEAPVDIYGASGTEGIARQGKAATAQVDVQVAAQKKKEQEATNNQIMAGMNQAGQTVANGINWNAGGQEGASLAPVLGSNGSASWINSNNGKYHDFDGAYGAQCVDLYNFYMTGFVGGRSSVGQVNYAQELWQAHDRSALVQVARNQRPQMGDIAIWSNAMNGQGGHVAIVAQDNGNGTIRVLNANATSAGSRGNTVMSNLSTGTLLGYLRPRKLM